MESLIGLIPFGLIALACPLAMLFMMRGMMGGDGKNEGHAASNAEPDRAMATRLARWNRRSSGCGASTTPLTEWERRTRRKRRSHLAAARGRASAQHNETAAISAVVLRSSS